MGIARDVYGRVALVWLCEFAAHTQRSAPSVEGWGKDREGGMYGWVATWAGIGWVPKYGMPHGAALLRLGVS